MVILLKRADLSIQGSTCCACSVVLALSSPLQPLSLFQAPHFLHFRRQQSHTSNSLRCDQTGENNVHIAASQRTQSATVSPGFCAVAGSSAALTCSSHLHLPTRHLGRQAVIWACLPDRYSPEQFPPGAHLYLQGALSPAKVIYVWLDLYTAAFVSAASASQCWNGGGIETSSYFITRKWRSRFWNAMPDTLVFR